MREAVIETLARALLASGARLLDLDTRELGCFPLGRSVVLHDNVPGGAGHVGELFEHAIATERLWPILAPRGRPNPAWRRGP